MVKVTAYLVVAGECNVIHDSQTADDSIVSSVIGSAIINEESRFIGSVGGTKVYSTECYQSEDECWIITVGKVLSHEEVTEACVDKQHIIWKPRSIIERIEDWFDRDERDPMLIKGNKSVI